MTDQPGGGSDLARRMLRQAVADAKKNGTATGKKQKPRRRLVTRDGGRDPVGLGAILDTLKVEHGWRDGVAGGTVLDQWATIAPELVGKVAAEAFNPDTGVLSLRPTSPAYGAQLRLRGPQMVARINTALGGTSVRDLRVLPPGPARGDCAAITPAPHNPVMDQRPQPAQPRTRDDAPPGYHRALAAAQAGRTENATDPHQDLRDRYFADVRGTLREPEQAFTDGQAALEQAQEINGGNDSETARQAAIKRTRDEKAGRAPALPTAFQRSA